MSNARWEKFDGLRHKVGEAVAAIQSLSEAECLNVSFLEQQFIPSLGLNDETLTEQPPEFSASFGKGLHIWQYPNQLAAYLVWLAKNVDGITSYMEIGCRWGGTFILVSEWIRKNGGRLHSITAVDPLEMSPLIQAYFDLLRGHAAAGHPPVEATYFCDLSTSLAVREAVERICPGLVFIDGNHELRGALSDHMLVRPYTRIIVHHDVCSQSCLDTAFLWETLKKLEAHEFDFVEFVDQYPSVKAYFLASAQ
jgi:hypothetical protein